MTPRAFTLTIPLPTFTVNQTRQMHHHTLARLVREYRQATMLLARSAGIPRLDRVAIEATPRGPLIRQDVGAAYPALKAAIDGLLDLKEKGVVVRVGILPDDTPEHVCRITMHQPRRGEQGLHLLIIDLADESPAWGCYSAPLPLGTTT